MTALLDRPTAAAGVANGPANLPTAPARTRVPIMLLGLLIVLGSGVGFALWSTDLSSREAVLVATRDISAGDVISDADFRVQELGGATDVAAIPAENESLFYGTVAVSDIAAGAVVNRYQFSESGGLLAGEAVVGVVLEPGANPVPRLRVGDMVEVIGAAENDEPMAAVAIAEVFAVRTASELSGSITVSLIVDRDDAAVVARAAERARVRLVLLPEAS